MRAVNIIIKIVVYSYIEDIGFCVTYFIALEMFHEFLFKSFFIFIWHLHDWKINKYRFPEQYTYIQIKIIQLHTINV